MRTIRIDILFLALVAITLPTTAVAQGPPGGGPPGGPPGGGPPSATVQVDCAAGDSIQAALNNRAQELTIEISGTCQENVVIRRGNVVLRGGDPNLDGIEAAGGLPLPNPVDVLSTFQVTLENLKLSGGTFGLGVDYSFAVDVVNCRLEGNSFGGVIAANSNLDLFDTAITGNARRGAIVNGGSFRCFDCAIADNPGGGVGIAVLTQEAARVTLVDTVLSGDFKGLDVRAGASAFVVDASSISSTPDGTGRGFAVDVRGAEVNLFGTPLEGPVRARSSQVDLTGVAQTIPAVFSFGNLIFMDSTLRLVGGSTLAGNLDVQEFSSAVIRGSASVQGNLSCSAGGDAHCDDPGVNVGGASSCDRCGGPSVADLASRVTDVEQRVGNLENLQLPDQIDDVAQRLADLESFELPDRVDQLEQRAAALEERFLPLFLNVDCGAGETIADALSQAEGRLGPLQIVVEGFCDEDVTILRDDVRLLGGPPGSGLRSIGLEGANGAFLSGVVLSGGATGLSARIGATFVAEHLTIDNVGSEAIRVEGGASGEMNHSTVAAAGVLGLSVVKNGELSFGHGVIDGNSSAIEVESGGSVSLNDVQMRNSTGRAVFAINGGSVHVGDDCVIEHAAIGVSVGRGGSVLMGGSGTAVRHNSGHGVQVDAGGAIWIIGLPRIHDNGGDGIFVSGGDALLQEARVDHNGGSGVAVFGASSLTVHSSEIRDNAADGVRVGDTSVAIFSNDSTVDGNAGFGVACEGSPSSALLVGDVGTVSGNGAGQISCPGFP